MKPTAVIVGPERLDELEQALRDAFMANNKGHRQAGQTYLITAIDLINQLRGRV